MKLVYSQQQTLSKKEILLKILLAAFLSVASMLVFFSMFSVPLHPFETSINIGGELIYAWNCVAQCLGESNFILLPKYQTETASIGSIAILLSVILFALNYFIIRSRFPIFLVIYALPFLLFPIVFNVYPEIVYSVLFMSAIVLAFSHMTSQRSLKIKTIFSIVFILAISLISTVLIAPDNYIKPKFAQSAGHSVDNVWYSIRYGDTLLGGENLDALGSREKSQSPALKVTMNAPDSLYLRGFVGSKLSDNGWENLSDGEYYADTSLFYWLHEYGFSGLSQINNANQQAKMDSDKDEIVNTIEVENVGADRSHVYMPYETIDYSKVDGKSYSDAYLKANGILGKSKYSFSVSENLVSSWPEIAAQVFTQKNTSELIEYKRLESHYNVNVYDNYTEVSDVYKELFSKELKKEKPKNKEHVGYKEAIKNIKNYLEDNFIYTETINPTGEKDFVESFIESKKGYDVHYATAATEMFRYYGIPARYVEGYLITPKDIETQAANSTIEITNEKLHAWTEIYIDILGWVPIEVAPEYYGVMKDPDMEKGLENISQIDELNKNENQIKKEEKKAETDNVKQTQLPWLLIISLILLLIILILLIILVKKMFPILLSYIKRERAFKQDNPRKAVCAIYAYMLDKSKLKEYEIREDRIKELGERAAYSEHEITENDRQYMIEKLKEMRGKKKYESTIQNDR